MDDDARLTLLLDEHESLVAVRIDELEGQIATLTDDRRGEVDDDEHDPEGFTLSSQWSMLAGLLETARAEQRRVEAARARIDHGTFGICETCGEPIPLAQLEARPWRDRCVACSS